MAATNGTTGLVTSWTSNSALISTGSAPSEFTLSVDAPEVPTPPLTSGGISWRNVIPNIYEWGGTIKTRLVPANIGNKGSITFTNNYVTNAKSWSIKLASTPQDSTAFTGSTVASRSFIPGLWGATGSFTCHVDTVTALKLPGIAAAALTLKVAEDGATDPGFTCNATCTKSSFRVMPGEIVEVTYDFSVDGDLTATVGAGTYATWLFSSGVVAVPTPGTLTLQSVTSRTYAGTAFPFGIALDCPVDGLVSASIDFKGSGDLTIS